MEDQTAEKAAFKGIRERTDPVAEKVIDDLFKKYDFQRIDQLFRHISSHIERGEYPDSSFERYMTSIGDLAEWIDMVKIKRAQEIFWDYGREILLSLMCRSLPMCYICANGAEVLNTTARLLDKPDSPKYERRLLETLQFVINICSDKSTFNDLGVGLISIKKVRLIHEAIRRYIHEQIDWPKKYGAPINQEDMCITICSFSIEVIKGLGKMGIYMEEADREAWCHLWCATAYLMGVEKELLCYSYAEFEALSVRILTDQARKSEPGEALVNSCIDFMASLLPHKILIPFSYSTLKYINDPKHHEQMGLSKKYRFWDWLLPILMHSTLGIDQKLEKSSGFFRWMISRFNQWLMKEITKKEMKDGKYFYLPKSLRS